MVSLLYLFGTALNNGPSGDLNFPRVEADDNTLKNGLAIMFGVLAVMAVIVIILGCMRYVYSRGNPQDTSKARATIIYAIVGLVIALSAEGLVQVLLNRI